MTPKHQTGLLFINYITNLNLLEYSFQKKKMYSFLRDILSICQLHILLSRTAQIYLELDTKKAALPHYGPAAFKHKQKTYYPGVPETTKAGGQPRT